MTTTPKTSFASSVFSFANSAEVMGNLVIGGAGGIRDLGLKFSWLGGFPGPAACRVSSARSAASSWPLFSNHSRSCLSLQYLIPHVMPVHSPITMMTPTRAMYGTARVESHSNSIPLHAFGRPCRGRKVVRQPAGRKSEALVTSAWWVTGFANWAKPTSLAVHPAYR